MDMLDSYKHRLRKAAAAFCAAAFLLGSVPAARAASVCPPPQVSAACASLIDGRTGQTLYEKDADRRALIASTTKIMTGLLVCEAGEVDRRVTVPAAAVGLEGSSMYLKRGETLTRRDLLYGMMLHSGNDAALTLAISVSGSEQAFVRQMNLRAQALGLRQTHFANPHGLDSGENYSSARDLAALAQAALQNPQFRTVVGTKTIACAGRTRQEPEKIYRMLCKPRGFVTTMHDEKGRRSVAELVADLPERVYPVGRLDCNSEGLLLLTNDGELANALMHPKKQVDKTYLVWVSSYIAGSERSLAQPIGIDGRMTSPAEVQLIKADGPVALLRITIREGRNRQIRRLCERAGLTVTRLRRIQEGPLQLGDLKPGQSRPLTQTELERLFEEIQK